MAQVAKDQGGPESMSIKVAYLVENGFNRE